MPKTYRIGTFNLEFGRSPNKVLDEVLSGCIRNNLDALVVQEAHDYYGVLSQHTLDYKYYVGTSSPSHKQVGILVRKMHSATAFRPEQAGDGWRTEHGAFHGPVALPQLVIDGKIALKGIHLPTPSLWHNGKVTGPPERVDDLKASMSEVVTWFGPKAIKRKRVHICCGDWNEPPSTTGMYSPNWVAAQTGSKIYSPVAHEAHGNIDYFMVKGDYDVKNVYQDNKLPENSDHELRVLVIAA